MKLLAVGNSFSQDATTFLHQTAAAQGVDLEVTNLYIGGCSLERHYQNLLSGKSEYALQLNGQPTGEMVSLPDMLRAEKWDWIVTQQASHDSGWADTYEPFLSYLINAFYEMAPTAKLALQETWAYEITSNHACFPRYHNDQLEMYDKLRLCYSMAAKNHTLPLIPCGDVIQRLRKKAPFCVQKGGRSLCRDGFHMSYSYGRYLLACTWLAKLFDISVKENVFTPESEEETVPSLLQLIRETVDEEMQEQKLYEKI